MTELQSFSKRRANRSEDSNAIVAIQDSTQGEINPQNSGVENENMETSNNLPKNVENKKNLNDEVFYKNYKTIGNKAQSSKYKLSLGDIILLGLCIIALIVIVYVGHLSIKF